MYKLRYNNSNKDNINKALYVLTGSKDAHQQLRILGYNLAYALTYGALYILLSTRYIWLYKIIMGV